MSAPGVLKVLCRTFSNENDTHLVADQPGLSRFTLIERKQGLIRNYACVRVRVCIWVHEYMQAHVHTCEVRGQYQMLFLRRHRNCFLRQTLVGLEFPG